MRRDFSSQALSELESQLNELKNEQLSFLTDFFGDLYLRVKHYLAKHGIVENLDDIRAYHKEVLDMENASLSQIHQIFEEISSVDSNYGAAGAGFAEPLETLELLRERMKALGALCSRTESAVLNGGRAVSSFSGLAVHVRTDQHEHYQKHIKEEEIRFTADSFRSLSSGTKSRYVQIYESLHTEDAILLDKVLSDPDLSEAERLDIRFMIYSAPEPYRSIYLEHLREYVVHVDDDIDGAYYSRPEIFIRDENGHFLMDRRGPYNTFFHESGHAIDDFENGSGYMLSTSYTYNGYTMNELVTADTRAYVENYMDSDPNLSRLTEAQRYEVLRSLNLTDDASFAYEGGPLADPVLEAARQAVIRHMNSDLAGDKNVAASDVYGGVTNNAITGTWGHYSSTYWYNGTTPTGSQEAELWAEFFSAKMTHDEVQLESIRRHFPRAYEAMEAMAEEMASMGKEG